MKLTLALIALAFSAQVFACSCSYDYADRDKSILTEMAQKLDIASYKDIKVLDYNVKYLPLSVIARDPHCHCSSFVRMIWDIRYPQNGQICVANVTVNVWNEKMKIKEVVCN